jgi:hypothetical protein
MLPRLAEAVTRRCGDPAGVLARRQANRQLSPGYCDASPIWGTG